MITKLATTAAALALLAASPAGATVLMGTGFHVPTDENLLFINNPPDALTIQGVTNAGTDVTISGGETLHGDGGQARVTAADGSLDSTFTYQTLADQLLGFDLTNPHLGFTSTSFRVFVGSGTATQATLSFADTAGHLYQQTFSIPKNGRFSAKTADGQIIDYFSVALNGSAQDVRQVRLGGVVGLPSAIPEPASWALMIAGFGGAGLLIRRRRSHAFA